MLWLLTQLPLHESRCQPQRMGWSSGQPPLPRLLRQEQEQVPLQVQVLLQQLLCLLPLPHQSKQPKGQRET